MSDAVEVVSKKMFEWFIKESDKPRLFENNNIRNTLWNMCASQIREIVEEGFRALSDEDPDQMIEIANKFYAVVNGLIWPDDDSRDFLSATVATFFLKNLKNV